MAERLVTHAVRNTQGDIVAIGNPEQDWYQRRSEWAISDIVAGRHRYFVPGAFGVPRPVGVVDGPSGLYLRAWADATEGNNLDSLPEFDLRPWEIALDNAEVLAVHAALVTHGAQGQVLLFGGDEHDPSNADNGEIFNTRIYDVDRNRIIGVNSPEADVFCCGHAYLGTGRLLVGGGTEGWNHPDELHIDAHNNPRNHWSGARECAVYNLDGTWSAAADLLPEPGQELRGGGRWYPTLLTLGDGTILAVGGHPRASEDPDVNDGRHGNWLPERYDPDTDSWSYQPGHWLYVLWSDVPTDPDNPVTLPDGQEPSTSNNYLYYPRLFTLPGGRVFLASPNDGRCGFYDPATGLIDEPTIGPPAHGAGFAETNHTAVLLPLLPADGYTPRVLFFGMQGPQRITLDLTDPDAPAEWEPTTSRDWPGTPPLRRHSCATLLPTGDVLVTGGINNDAGAGLPDTDGVREAELYHPGFDWDAGVVDFGQESWVTTPPATVVRNYHSVALLLPNGRVLTAGSNLNGQSGGDNVKEYRIEIYCPAYDGDPNRPSIISAPNTLSYGESFTIGTTRANRVQRVALIRCGSVTHAWDGDQRYVGLEFHHPQEGTLEAVAPPDGNIAPPGPYMLWVIDNENHPCQLAQFVVLS